MLSNAIAQDNFRVRNIEFLGNQLFSENQLLTIISTNRNGYLNENNLNSDVNKIIELYKEEGYLHLRVDSISIIKDTNRFEAEINIFLYEGKQSVIEEIKLSGCEKLSEHNLMMIMSLKPGEPFVSSRLEQDIKLLLQLYAEKGFPLAKVSISNILFTDTLDKYFTNVKLEIEEGKPLDIEEIRIEGNKTTKDYVIIREARLPQNQRFYPDMPSKIKSRLDRLQLFSTVDIPELYLNEGEKGGLLIRLTEGNHNSFDGVLGYVPAKVSGKSGYLTGLVNLSFRNLFGTGRKLFARWYQEDKSSQETELNYFEPWVASYPINLLLGFFQRKQDSTFVSTQYKFAVEMMLTELLTFGASFSQTNVFPTEGYGKLIVPESKTMNYGISIKYDSRNSAIMPIEGILYTTEYKAGKKSITSANSFADSKTSTNRILFDIYYYFPTFIRQVVSTELHIRDVRSDKIDISDLFQLGGAATLRGYRERQFFGSRLVWTNLEYRFIMGSRSFFYGFVDIGYISRPSDSRLGIHKSEQRKIGYGIGVQLDSALGNIGVSFALGEGDTFSTSKIHIRLINEF